MAVITSMYEEMDANHRKNMMNNQEHIINMLDFAIKELVHIGEENELFLMDDCCLCETYDQIFDCLKHWSVKRMQENSHE